MELVKFSSKDKNERLFVNTLRKNVHDYFKENQLSPKANFAMVVKTIVMISLYIVPYILILSIGMPTFDWVTAPTPILKFPMVNNEIENQREEENCLKEFK